MTTPPPGQWPPPPQGPPQWNPQPGPPSKGGNKAKWILGGLVLLVVVVVSVVATLLVTRGSSGSTTPTASGPSTSARTAQPIAIITNEPTCGQWNSVNNALSAAQDNGWSQLDPSVPASAWTLDQLAQYRAVGEAMRAAADQSTPLAQQTPNPAMAALYIQFIAYARDYANGIPLYEPKDDHLARATSGFALALSSICNAIASGSAEARSATVPESPAVRSQNAGGYPPGTRRFLMEPNAVCPEVASAVSDPSRSTAAWRTTDPNVPASKWGFEQRSLNDTVVPVLNAFADEIEDLGKRSDNPVFDQLSRLGAQYQRAFTGAIPSYIPADNYLNEVATGVANAINEACFAVGG